jgi:hypothetical protein
VQTRYVPELLPQDRQRKPRLYCMRFCDRRMIAAQAV